MTTKTHSDLPQTCSCGRKLKNLKGLRIHQGRTRCSGYVARHRLEAISSETREDTGPDSNHRANDLPAGQQTTEHEEEDHQVFEDNIPEGRGIHDLTADNFIDDNAIPTAASIDEVIKEARARSARIPARKERINWPASTETVLWKSLDNDLDDLFRVSLRGSVEGKINTLMETVYRISIDRFGIKESKTKSQQLTNGTSRRQTNIAEIRKELKQLKRLWKNCKEEEKPGLHNLRQNARERLKTLRKAENSAKKRKAKKRQRDKFFRNPYQFASNLLGKAKSGTLNCSKEELEGHLSHNHNDARRNTPLDDFEGIMPAKEPELVFDMSDMKLSEIDKVVQKGRSAGAPGPSGTSYKVYKNCPKLRRRLWKLYRILWKKKSLP